MTSHGRVEMIPESQAERLRNPLEDVQVELFFLIQTELNVNNVRSRKWSGVVRSVGLRRGSRGAPFSIAGRQSSKCCVETP